MSASWFPIRGGQVRLDHEDAIRFVGVSLYVASNGYVKRGDTNAMLHREILGVTDPAVHVDHINGDVADNRRENLRACTRSQNLCNQRLRSTNTSGCVGVWLVKKTGHWCAQIQVDRKMHTLGHFARFEDAVTARREAELRFHGEFSGTEGVRANGDR